MATCLVTMLFNGSIVLNSHGSHVIGQEVSEEITFENVDRHVMQDDHNSSL